MTCTTCGRENPPHLTFCQECGQRLGPRIAPPTPPIGLGPQDSNQGAYGPPPTAPQTLADPNALKPRVATSLGMTAAATDRGPAKTPPPPPGYAERRCGVCETINAPNLRYCTSCGSTLEAGAAASPATPVATPGAGSGGQGAIAPMQVVNLAAPAVPRDAVRSCPRCRGGVDPAAQFCKFCGASLAEVENGRAVAAGTGQADAYAPTPAPPPMEERRSSGTAPRQIAVAAPAPQPAGPYGPPGGPKPASPSGPPVLPPQPTPPPRVVPVGSVARGAATRGRLVVIAKSGADGPSYPFGDSLDIGRVEGNIVVGEDPYLSPRHVRILWQNGKLFLRDLGSTNGVFVRLAPSRDMNGRRDGSGETSVPLLDQDVVLVGQQVLRFEVLKEAEGGFGAAQEHGTLLFGSPAAPRYARLGQRTVEGITRDVYYVRKVETVLGRESGDVVFTEDPFLSRRHAAIRVLARDGTPLAATAKPAASEPARFALVDLGSSNGTFLKVRGDIELVPSDYFRVGQQLFRVDFGAVRD